MFNLTHLDHVGIRVTDRDAAIAFYEQLGFRIDPEEDSPAHKATGLVHDAGMRIHLIYNSPARHHDGNILLDSPVKWPGYTHAAFIVDSLEALLDWLAKKRIAISEGPVTLGHGRRRTVFIRDPDLNVVEFNEILKP